MKFYSDKTRELYESEELLSKAEKEFDAAAAEKKALKSKRAERAKEVEEAFNDAAAARKKADELLEKFLKDYDTFHTTVKEPISSIFDDIFNKFFF